MYKEVLLNLTKRLYPRSRAFKMAEYSLFESLNKGLIESENKVFTDINAVLYSILPDNDNFTLEDANTWERRLGIISNDNTTLDDKKKAIQRKYNYPGTIKARQHYLYLQESLQKSGFDVYVHENRFPQQAIIPEQLGVSEMGNCEMGAEINNPDKYSVVDPNSLITTASMMGVGIMGAMEMGATVNYSLCANYINEYKDRDVLVNYSQPPVQLGLGEMGIGEMGGTFDYQKALRSTFYVGGQTFGDFADVPNARKNEFRQIILKLKPTQTVGILLINYI